MHTTAPASHLGKLVDSRYRLRRVVGEGASSWVFAAEDQRLEREVALKLFKPPASEDDLKRRKRCIAEGRTLAKLVHPHIVAIHDAIEDGSGQAYLVMELCEAGTLEAELAERGRLELADTLRLVLPLMGALAFAHDRNIVHRDIKPANIVLVEERGERRCKLLDFGISLGAGVSTNSDLVLGTPAYMAPEQARGEPTTPATDVWALGIVLFRCLTGSLPFEASSSAGILLQIVHGRAPRLASVCDPKRGPNVMLALDRALEPDLQRRYRDVRSFARALAVACAVDQVSVMQRPEPIGLPQFDVWVAGAKSTPTTQQLPIATQTGSDARVAETKRLPRSVIRVAIAGLIAAVVGGALSLSNASERDQPTPALRSLVSAAPASAAADAPGPGPLKEEQAAASITAAPSRAPDLPPPAPVLEEKKVVAVESPKRRSRRERPVMKAKPSAPPAAPRVIMSWDW